MPVKCPSTNPRLCHQSEAAEKASIDAALTIQIRILEKLDKETYDKVEPIIVDYIEEINKNGY